MRQHYSPPRRAPVWPWLVILVALIGTMVLINTDEEDARRTAEAKLSAALDDAYQDGVRDALGRCHK